MNPYLEQAILNADPVELIAMVYQRAISCVRDAREHLRHKRIAQRSAAIVGAYAALAELVAALRPEMAPELAGRLQNLYFYMQRRLLDANAQQIDQPLAEVLRLLSTLAEGWSGVAAKLTPNRYISDTDEAQDGGKDGGQGWGKDGGQAAQEYKDDTTRLAISA